MTRVAAITHVNEGWGHHRPSKVPKTKNGVFDLDLLRFSERLTERRAMIQGQETCAGCAFAFAEGHWLVGRGGLYNTLAAEKVR